MDEIELTDLGDAMQETRQSSIIPPLFLDAIFGLGSKPNT